MCPQPLQTAAVMTLTWGEESHPKPEPFLQLVLFPGNWQQAKISWSEKTLPNMSNLQIEKKKKAPTNKCCSICTAHRQPQGVGCHRVGLGAQHPTCPRTLGWHLLGASGQGLMTWGCPFVSGRKIIA